MWPFVNIKAVGSTTESSLENKIWWGFVHEDLRELFKESVVLLAKVKTWEDKFHDYAFVVFPAAKAYEGFLKTLFLQLGFVSQDEFYGKRFRVGKALNPALEKIFRRQESVYDRLVKFCGGSDLADGLWETWKESRNLLFHWFPNERNAITLEEAGQRINSIFAVMDKAFKECKIDRVEE